MSEHTTVFIDAEEGTSTSKIIISQFTDNFDTIKFTINKNLSDYTVMIITESGLKPMIIECDGVTLAKEYNEYDKNTVITWKPSLETTFSEGLVIYQIVAYKSENDEIVSTWYSKEGRIIVTDSIDSTPFSEEMIGAYPNLISRLIISSENTRNLADTLSKTKVDKIDGKSLSSNDFTDELVTKLNALKITAEENVINAVKVDGITLPVNEPDKSVNIDITSRINEYDEENTQKIDSMYNSLYAEISKKADAEDGKGLSSNDYTDAEQTKLSTVESGAQVNVQSDWNNTDSTSDSYIKNRPSLVSMVKCDFPDCSPEDPMFANELTGISGAPATLYYGTKNGWSSYFIIAVKTNEDTGLCYQYGIPYADREASEKYGKCLLCYRQGELIYDPEYNESYYSWTKWTPFITHENISDYIYTPPVTHMPEYLSRNTAYNFGEVLSASLRFPLSAVDGDVNYITFESGETPTELIFKNTNVVNADLIPKPNTGYEIFAKYNGKIWIIHWSSYDLS